MTNQIPDGYARLEDSERRAHSSATFLGLADTDETITVTIELRRRPDGPEMPNDESFLSSRQSQRRRMSAHEFAALYGASPEDIELVTDFASSHGLTVVETHPARRTIVVSGTVAQMNEAFGIELGTYEHDIPHRTDRHQTQRETYRGREGFIHVPEELSDIVIGVFGLDNRTVTKRNKKGNSNFIDNLSHGRKIPVAELRDLYQFPNNLADGQTIAVFSSTSYDPADIDEFYSSQIRPFCDMPPRIIDIAVGSSQGNTREPELETTQDICIAATAGLGASIAVYFTTDDQRGWIDLVKRVTYPDETDPMCSVLTTSFYISNGDDPDGLIQHGVSKGFVRALSRAFHDAAMQGVTVCVASGDEGADSKMGDGYAHVQYPASDPWVLSVGGTTVRNVQGMAYEEYAWNDKHGATGGGISDFFPVPRYQRHAGIPSSVNDSHRGRGVPDVAANASPISGVPIIVNGRDGVGAGTSASAPLWAGLIAIINNALETDVGFINPILYEIGPEAFMGIFGPPGPQDNAYNGTDGYPTQQGWNACTGWGSINGKLILRCLEPYFT